MGGSLSCTSVLRRQGVWVPPQVKTLHVRGNEKAHRAHPRRYCSQFTPPGPVTVAVDDIDVALRHALRCLDAEGIVVVCDSILNRTLRFDAGLLVPDMGSRLLTPTEVESCFTGAPIRVCRLLDRIDARAQSGTETMVRLRLRAKGVHVNVQVKIDGIGHVDLVVGNRLIIEVDGRAYHENPYSYAEDRRRDRVATKHNLLRMRLTYEDVIYNWAEAEADIMFAVREGHHRERRHTQQPGDVQNGRL